MDLAELDDVDEQEEVPGEAELLDDVELVGDLMLGTLVVGVRRRVSVRGAAPRELAQPRHVGVARRHLEIGQVRRREAQVERARLRDLDGALDRAGPAGEAALLLARRRKCANGAAGSQPSISSSDRRARIAASAVASGRCAGVA